MSECADREVAGPLGKGMATPRVVDQDSEMGTAAVEDVLHIEQSSLVGRITPRLRNGEAPVERVIDGVALPIHLRRRDPEASLETHLIGASDGVGIERDKGAPG